MEQPTAAGRIGSVFLSLPHRGFAAAFRVMQRCKNPAAFGGLSHQHSELTSRFFFFWRVSTLCSAFNKVFTVFLSQSCVHPLQLQRREEEEGAACGKLAFGMTTGCCHRQCPLTAGWDWIQCCSVSIPQQQSAGAVPSVPSSTHPHPLPTSGTEVGCRRLLPYNVLCDQSDVKVSSGTAARGASSPQDCTATVVFLTAGAATSPSNPRLEELQVHGHR